MALYFAKVAVLKGLLDLLHSGIRNSKLAGKNNRLSAGMVSSAQRALELQKLDVLVVKVSTCSSHGIRHTESGLTLNKGAALHGQLGQELEHLPIFYRAGRREQKCAEPDGQLETSLNCTY